MFLTGWFLFVIFEIAWNPYKDLKNISNKDLQETLNK